MHRVQFLKPLAFCADRQLVEHRSQLHVIGADDKQQVTGVRVHFFITNPKPSMRKSAHLPLFPYEYRWHRMGLSRQAISRSALSKLEAHRSIPLRSPERLEALGEKIGVRTKIDFARQYQFGSGHFLKSM